MRTLKKVIFLFIVFSLFLPSLYSSNFKNSGVESQSFSLQTFVGTFNVTTFVSPDNSYEAIVNAIDSATYEIDLEIYLFSHPYLLDAIHRALQRNNSMVVNIIMDDNPIGASGYNRYIAYNLTSSGYPNVNIFWASSTFTFTHAKFCIIDREIVIVESANWAKSSIPLEGRSGNREWGVIIKDERIADYFLQVFNNDMLIAEPVTKPPTDYIPPTYTFYGSYSPNFESQNFVEYMRITPVLSPDTSRDAILNLINSANESIEIQQMYIYSDDAVISEFINAILDAKNRGVSVRVILDDRTDKNNQTAELLSSYGIEVAFSSSEFDTMHNKGIIVDGKVVLVSSINWSSNSVENNREAGVIIYNEDVASYFLEVFNYDWSKAEPYSYEGEGGTEGSIWDYLIYIAVALILAVVALVKKLLKK
ncbi:MAG: phospholipase D-like domain-containing protein [Candidatus Asgardarchaeia archaeon]